MAARRTPRKEPCQRLTRYKPGMAVFARLPEPLKRLGQLADRERRARIIGEWLQTEARFLAS